MKMITPGIAQALTPREWEPRRPQRPERAPRTFTLRVPRLHLPRPHLPHVALPHLHTRSRAH